METEPKGRKLTKKQLSFLGIILVCFVILLFFINYQNETGRLPISWFNSPESILPPELHPTEQTYDQVMSFIKSDDTDTIEYGEGFNCVDASFRLFLNARWHGIAAALIRVNYEDSSTHHMVVAFPTSDRGDIVIEPQYDTLVRPRVGGSYDGKRVSGLYILNAIWEPLEGSPPLDSSYRIE